MHTKQKGGASFMQQVTKKKQTDCAISSNSDDSEDEVEELQVLTKDVKKQRFSVSAEAYGKHNRKEDFKPRNIPKTPQQIQNIKQRLTQGFMFSGLDEKNREIVIGAMEEKRFKKGEWVIKQGEEGNVLFVVDSGELDCYKNYGDKEDKYLKTYVQGESFGELALLFQSPRAASIRVKSEESVLWQLDRETFNIIVKEASIKKREKYESFLQKWELLKELDDDPYEKLKMSDAFFEKKYQEGDTICKQGGRFDEICIIDRGRVGVYKDKSNQIDNLVQIMEFSKLGEYFGEISIARNQDEPFAYTALEETNILYIPKKSYSSTLKIIDNTIQKRIQQKYGKYL